MLHKTGMDEETEGESSLGEPAEHVITFKNPVFEAIHSAASGLFSVGGITPEVMNHFDEVCITGNDDQPHAT